MAVYRLAEEIVFPNPNHAEESGLLAVGGDLSASRLLTAYSNGIFPWYSEGDPLLWFSPNPRLVLYPNDFKVSKSLRKTINSGRYKVSVDRRFVDVINACAKIPRDDQDGTWITAEMMQAYIVLHELGYAHSVEVFEGDDLVGGLYGISLGKAFFGESMFHQRPNASKVALSYLVGLIREWNFDFIDAQVPTEHMKRMGAKEVSRIDFLDQLSVSMQNDSRVGSWCL